MSEEKQYHDHKCECGKVWKCAVVDCSRDPKCFLCEFGKRKLPSKRKELTYSTCPAGNNCWLSQGLDWCGVCKTGDEKAWRKKCDAAREAQGTPSYAEALESAQKSFAKSNSGQEK